MQRITKQAIKQLTRFHRDQRGAMSIVSVFTIILLGFLLGMVLNVCKQADSKVRMQNAADAATYASGIVTARGMNSLAFTNHLLCDIFALTAFLREGRDNHAKEAAHDILDAWEEAAAELDTDSFSGFTNWLGQYPDRSDLNFAIPDLGESILQMVPKQRELIDTFSHWAESFSESALDTLETILDDELIPQYQRALVAAIPTMAQEAAREVAQRHGLQSGKTDPNRDAMGATVWVANRQTSPFEPQETISEFALRQDNSSQPDGAPAGLPVVDPSQSQILFYTKIARSQRKRLVEAYLSHWNGEKLEKFAEIGPMSRFRELWTSFAQGQLETLLDENQDTNLLHVIWTPYDLQIIPTSLSKEDLRPMISFYWNWQQRNYFLEQQYMFVGAVYWKPVRHFLPGLFENPIAGDRVNCAQGMLFLPVPRLHYGVDDCYKVNLLDDKCVFVGSEPEITRIYDPIEWNLLNQNWRFKLVPTMMPELAMILSQPYVDFAPADISGLSHEEIFDINTH